MFTRVHHLSLILNHINPVHTLTPYLVLSFQLHLGLPSVLFPSGSLNKVLNKFLTSPVDATCPTHLVILDFVLIMFCEHHKLWSSSLCNFSNFPSLLSSQVQVFSSSPCPQTSSIYVLPLLSDAMCHNHTKLQIRI